MPACLGVDTIADVGYMVVNSSGVVVCDISGQRKFHGVVEPRSSGLPSVDVVAPDVEPNRVTFFAPPLHASTIVALLGRDHNGAAMVDLDDRMLRNCYGWLAKCAHLSQDPHVRTASVGRVAGKVLGEEVVVDAAKTRKFLKSKS